MAMFNSIFNDGLTGGRREISAQSGMNMYDSTVSGFTERLLWADEHTVKMQGLLERQSSDEPLSKFSQ